jgi:ATP adenylyltransferase
MTEAEQRLWTPWRMRYIGGDAKEDGCVFCNRLRAGNDVASLILQRGANAFVIMNLFPYNTGHVMIVPDQHVADLDDLSVDAAIDMALLAPRVTRALRRVLACAGFNLGLNVGDVAGAGVAEHLHQHVVPRWVGDANFMPILASTMVIPELIPVTYAKVRAELQRELTGDATCAVVALSDDDQSVLLHRGRLPKAVAREDEPVWKAALGVVRSGISDIEIASWAGAERADGEAGPMAITVQTHGEPLHRDWSFVTIDEVIQRADPRSRAILRQAQANLAPRVRAADEQGKEGPRP